MRFLRSKYVLCAVVQKRQAHGTDPDNHDGPAKRKTASRFRGAKSNGYKAATIANAVFCHPDNHGIRKIFNG